MYIAIKQKSEVINPTEFDSGEIIEFIDNELDTKFLVVGENDFFLHIFEIGGAGSYYGINKNPDANNLKGWRALVVEVS